MHRLLVGLVLILSWVPGPAWTQEIVRASRYERAGMDERAERRIDSMRSKYRIPAGVRISSPTKGEDIVLHIHSQELTTEFPSAIDLHAAPFLATEGNLREVFLLHRREPVVIEEKAYSFELRDGNALIYMVEDGRVVNEILGEGQAWLVGNMVFVVREGAH